MNDIHRIAVLAAIFVGGMTAEAHSIAGDWEFFGSEGRLYSRKPNEYYLLSRRPTVWPRSVIYEGEVRIRETYEGGGYEEKRRHFSLDCDSDGVRAGPSPTIGWLENEKSIQPSRSATISSSGNPKTPAMKADHNLYWAVCRGVFQKFK